MFCKPTLLSVALAVFVRLPLGFVVPFVVLTFAWIFDLYKRWTAGLDFRQRKPLEHIIFLKELDDVLYAIMMVLIFLAGLLLIYNISVFINLAVIYLRRKLARPAYARAASRKALPSDNLDAAATNTENRGGAKALSADADANTQDAPKSELDPRKFLSDKKIGLVLAGGGAKGAFQAGAMKAIYQFLDENDALDRVKVIAATSIGSWNALFWLARLVEPEEGWGEKSAHEKWWREIRLRKLVTPSWYVPTFRNAFFRTTPWEEQFENIFKEKTIQDRIIGSGITFYFTRSHVRSGKLECVTNNPKPTHMARVSFRTLQPLKKNFDRFMDGVKTGVFASMDLPPLFPYVELATDYFEDGGVIDNLPIIFPATDGCDLIFVLPLNSDFYAEPNFRSIISRFFRVMDVRQGVLERNSLKILYLYNEIAALREYVARLKHHVATLKQRLEKHGETLGGEMKANGGGAQVPENTPSPFEKALERALKREHGALRIFAVCPVKSFVQSTLDTQELWKRKQAAVAFDVMYDATRELLDFKFAELMEHEKIQVALVGREGGYTLDDNF
jgi:NTE family protein